MQLALFDLDHTLLAADSNDLWISYLTAQGYIAAETAGVSHAGFMRDYRAGILQIRELFAFRRSLLAHMPMDTQIALRDDFFQAVLKESICPDTNALLAHHRQAGHLLALVSATDHFLVEPVANLLGIEHVLANDPADPPTWPPCFAAGKIARVETFLLQRGTSLKEVEASWFYSDSINDLPLLEAVTHAVAVDPDTTLRQHAWRRGWQVISLRGMGTA